MKHRNIIAIISLFLLFAISLNGAVLKKNDKFLPFSLVSSLDDIYTVTLEDGRLTVKIQPLVGGEEKVIHPDAVLLDFWATWCVPCRKAMPHMQKLHEKFGPSEPDSSGGLVLLGISLDDKGNKVVKPFFNRLGYTYPMLADPTDGSGDIIRQAKDMKSHYQVQAIPVVYLIDSEGIIRHAHTGFREKDIQDIEKVINELAQENSR